MCIETNPNNVRKDAHKIYFLIALEFHHQKDVHYKHKYMLSFFSWIVSLLIYNVSKCVELPWHYFSFPSYLKDHVQTFHLFDTVQQWLKWLLTILIHSYSVSLARSRSLPLTLFYFPSEVVWESEGVFISAFSRLSLRLSLRLRLEDTWVLMSLFWDLAQCPRPNL